MKVSINWIKDFVNLDGISESDLINKFTLSTAEIEDVLYEGELLHKVKIVEITHIEKHPDAEKLNLVTFKLSENESFRVVCGASNVEVGKKVPFAPLGTTFSNGLTLTPKKIRGVVSEGMLCSGEELDFEESSDGLYILASDAPVGEVLGKYLGIEKDIILDIGRKTVDLIEKVIISSKTVFWNGPAGYFENPNFALGSYEIAKMIIKKNKDNSIFSVAGGGDTIAVLNQINARSDFNFVSTAGGAFLEYLEGKELPGIKALN